jgi:hypothetical protein
MNRATSSTIADIQSRNSIPETHDLNPRIEWQRWVIVALFVVLGATYSVVTPIFEASDEISHYPVVEHIATTGHLPVQEPGVVTLWEQEGSQPPLYYLASAALTFWIDTSDLEERLWRNPYAKLGLVLDPDNKNRIIHTEAEQFPWRRTVLAIHLIRLFSVGLGAASVALAYELMRTVWPDVPEAAATGAVLMAFNPMFLFITGSVNNDNLIVLLATWTLLLAARILRDGLTTQRAATLAVVLALATIAKVSGLTLIPIVGLGLLVHALRTNDWKRAIVTGLGLIGAWLALAGWWYVRNLVLYDELLGIQTHVAIVGGREEATLAALRREWYGFWVSYWGLFGTVNIMMAWQIYRAFTIMSLTGIAGLAWWACRKSREGNCQALIAPGLMALCTLAVFASVVRWTMITYGSQGRLMFPALAAINGLLGAGLVALAPVRWRHITPLPIGSAMLALAAVAPFRYIAPAYAPPPIVDSVPGDAIPVNLYFGEHLELLAIRTENTITSEGRRIPVTLYWRLNEPMSENYTLFLRALGRAREEVGRIDTFPGGGVWPTSRMPTGVIIEDRYSLGLDSDIETPSAVRILVGMRDAAAQQIVRPTAEDGLVSQTILVTAGVAMPREQPEAAPSINQQALVGGFAELLGYDINSDDSRPGEIAEVTLYWRGLAATEDDMMVSIYLIDEHGRPLAQTDGPPLAGDYPTMLWQPGIWIADVHYIAIPEETPPGEYRLLVGFHNAGVPLCPSSGACILNDESHSRDAIILGTTISVAEP